MRQVVAVIGDIDSIAELVRRVLTQKEPIKEVPAVPLDPLRQNSPLVQEPKDEAFQDSMGVLTCSLEDCKERFDPDDDIALIEVTTVDHEVYYEYYHIECLPRKWSKLLYEKVKIVKKGKASELTELISKRKIEKVEKTEKKEPIRRLKNKVIEPRIIELIGENPGKLTSRMIADSTGYKVSSVAATIHKLKSKSQIIAEGYPAVFRLPEEKVDSDK